MVCFVVEVRNLEGEMRPPIVQLVDSDDLAEGCAQVTVARSVGRNRLELVRGPGRRALAVAVVGRQAGIRGRNR